MVSCSAAVAEATAVGAVLLVAAGDGVVLVGEVPSEELSLLLSMPNQAAARINPAPINPATFLLPLFCMDTILAHSSHGEVVHPKD